MSEDKESSQSDPMHAVLADMRLVAHHLAPTGSNVSPVRAQVYKNDSKRTVDIAVPDAWRHGNTTIPRFLPHTYNPLCEAFPAAFGAPDNRALVCWLAPSFAENVDASSDKTLRAGLDYKAHLAVSALSEMYDIPLQYRLVVPREPLRSQLGAHACAALFIGTTPEHKDRLVGQVWRGMEAQYTNRHLLQDAKPASWESLMAADATAVDTLKLEAITTMAQQPSELHTITNDRLVLETPRSKAGRVRHETVRVARLNERGAYKPEHMLVLWLAPQFELNRRQSAHPAANEYAGAREFQTGELENFCEALQHSVGSSMGYQLMSYTPPRPNEPIALALYSKAASGDEQYADLKHVRDLLDPMIDQHLSERERFTQQQR